MSNIEACSHSTELLRQENIGAPLTELVWLERFRNGYVPVADRPFEPTEEFCDTTWDRFMSLVGHPYREREEGGRSLYAPIIKGDITYDVREFSSYTPGGQLVHVRRASQVSAHEEHKAAQFFVAIGDLATGTIQEWGVSGVEYIEPKFPDMSIAQRIMLGGPLHAIKPTLENNGLPSGGLHLVADSSTLPAASILSTPQGRKLELHDEDQDTESQELHPLTELVKKLPSTETEAYQRYTKALSSMGAVSIGPARLSEPA
ncbi:hypothetical protein BH23PAT1_BH23PAT1_0590 [soil metagenome]